MIPTREQLEQGRHVRYKVYGYFRSFCNANSSCDGCDPVIRFGCVLKRKIEKTQEKRILRICQPENPAVRKHWGGAKRVLIIFLRAVTGVHSPSMGRRVRISDIWKSPDYMI